MNTRLKVIGTLTALVIAVLGYSPAMAQDAAGCSCMCVEGSPEWVCANAGPFQPTAPASCTTMQCPSVETPPADTADDTVSAPSDGLVCKRRWVFRPDLGRYKRYKVCEPVRHHDRDDDDYDDDHDDDDDDDDDD